MEPLFVANDFGRGFDSRRLHHALLSPGSDGPACQLGYVICAGEALLIHPRVKGAHVRINERAFGIAPLQINRHALYCGRS